jgi:chromosome segregation ATPase
MLFNKYLKRKIIKEQIDNRLLETTFQEVKKITGIANIKQVVDRVSNKDKDYNLCVSKMNEREAKINFLKQKIDRLDQDFTELKSSASIDPIEGKKAAKQENYDLEDEALTKEEEKLRQDLEDMKEKNKNVDLIYEKVLENLKAVTKHQDPEVNKSHDGSNSTRSSNLEDDLIVNYRELVSKMNDKAEAAYSKVIPH